jgi:holliday junction DNA helicase RuvA
MIAELSGTVSLRKKGALILRVGGVGYRVQVPALTLSHLTEAKSLTLFTHLTIRENAHELYGFESEQELSFFELLLSVPGIGPKSALAILNLADVRTLSSAIASGDSVYLTKVSGIGKKSAQKIVLELKDKVELMGTPRTGSALEKESEALEALQALGYSLKDAREALKEVTSRGVEPDNLIKFALKNLSR